MSHPPLAQVTWPKAYRIIPSRFPPIDVFEEFGNSDLLAELEGISNPRLREQWGDIAIVPPGRRVTGPGATYVMAPFTHPNKNGSRFSDGSYGMYYAANGFETAVAETVYHMARFYAATNDPPHQTDFRCLVGTIDNEFHDIRDDAPPAVMDPDDYGAGQALGRTLRDVESNGIVYISVRNDGGENLGAFWPDVIGIPVQERHLIYRWDGTRIDRVFDHRAETWLEVK